MSDCCICYEEFKRLVSCPSCDIKCCVGCTKKHIISLPNEPACPSCKFIWSTEFCNNHLSKSFMNKAYKQSRIDLVYEAEQTKLTKTMVDVNNMIESEKYTEKIDNSKVEINELQKLLNEKKQELHKMRETQRNLKKPNYKKNEGFKLKCPKSDCMGCLKSDYICVVCDAKVCDKCMEIIPNHNSSEDGESKHKQHVCNPDIVATVQMIQDESKPCPGCSELISKINGCDQMWCIKCNIAYSWDTGKIDYGRVHNPHFIEWRRQNNKTNTRQPGEILCGGLANKHEILLWKKFAMNAYTLPVVADAQGNTTEYYHKIKGISVINENNARKIEMSNNPRYGNDPRLTMFHINFPIFKNIENQERFFTWLYELRDNIDTFRYWTLDHYRTLATEEDITRKMRIKFIRKIINEETFKKNIYRMTQKKQKNLEILHVFELCYVVSVEQFNEIYHILSKLDTDICTKYKNDIYTESVKAIGKKQTLLNYKNYRINMWLKFYPKIFECIENIENIIMFCNKLLHNIALKYKTSTPFLNENYTIGNFTIKSSTRDMYFLHKKNSLQRVNRCRYNRDDNNWEDWQDDVVPVKGLFDLKIYANKIIFHKDGSWYEDKGIRRNEDANNEDANEAQIVREPDGAIRV